MGPSSIICWTESERSSDRVGLTRAQASKSDLPNTPEREIGKGFRNL